LKNEVRTFIFFNTVIRQFNQLVGHQDKTDEVKCTQPKVLRIQNLGWMSKMSEWWMVEEEVEGEFLKYSDNTGWIIRSDTTGQYWPEDDLERFHATMPLMESLQHFSWVTTEGKSMIMDIQGSDRYLTDLVLGTLKGDELSLANLGITSDTLHSFFKAHQCSRTCIKLKIEGDRCNVDYEPPAKKRRQVMRTTLRKKPKTNEEVET
jgi:hypothetical protein